MPINLRRTNNIAAVQASLSRAVQQAVKDTAVQIAEDAKTRVPIETGELRNSIAAVSNGFQGEITVNSDHALFMEVGTEKQAAQPFLSPSVMDNANGFASRITEGLK